MFQNSNIWRLKVTSKFSSNSWRISFSSARKTPNEIKSREGTDFHSRWNFPESRIIQKFDRNSVGKALISAIGKPDGEIFEYPSRNYAEFHRSSWNHVLSENRARMNEFLNALSPKTISKKPWHTCCVKEKSPIHLTPDIH